MRRAAPAGAASCAACSGKVERFGITPGGQGAQLLQFGGVGILLAVLYDGFRLWRILTSPPPRRVFFQDLVFFVLAAAITQLLALPISRGKIRLFHLLAVVLGGGLYLQTAGRLTGPLFHLIRAGWDRFCGGMTRLWGKWSGQMQKAGQKAQHFSKKVGKKLKNLLHLPHKI